MLNAVTKIYKNTCSLNECKNKIQLKGVYVFKVQSINNRALWGLIILYTGGWRLYLQISLCNQKNIFQATFTHTKVRVFNIGRWRLVLTRYQVLNTCDGRSHQPPVCLTWTLVSILMKMHLMLAILNELQSCKLGLAKQQIYNLSIPEISTVLIYKLALSVSINYKLFIICIHK